MDYLVIGAGPAGLQLGYFLERAKRDYWILEGGPAAGSFFRTFPRHRTLISVNKARGIGDDPELNLRTDWNSLLSHEPGLLFGRYSARYFPPADEMVRYLGDYAQQLGLRIQYDTRVTRVERAGPDAPFRVLDSRGEQHEARRVIVATGVPQPYIPAIPGIELAERYVDMSVEPDDFLGQRVLIIGKGNSAFETADNLIETAAVIHVAGPSSVRMAWKSHYVGHLRAVNNNFLDTYQLKSANAVLDGNIAGIERSGEGYLVTVSFSRANEVKKDIYYDRVIACTGFRFDASIFADACRPELVHDARLPAQSAEWESTNVRDLYFAGTLMQVRDYKKSTGGFIHGFRYGVRALHRMLELKYHGSAWPHRRLPADPEALMQAVVERVNRTSALWQLFASMGDLIVVGREGARYYEELPVDYAHESAFGDADSYFLITLEYGPGHDQHDPFDISVARIMQSEVEHSDKGRYLHPVVRHFGRRAQLAEHHMTENLENDWGRPATHREPLRAFFARQLGQGQAAVLTV